MGKFGVSVAEVNCTEFLDICKAEKIKKPPQIKLYNKYGEKKYSDDNDAESIVKFVEDETKKSVRMFRTKEDAEEIFPDYGEVTIGYFEDRKNIEFQTFESITGSPKDNEIFIAVINPHFDKSKVEHVTPGTGKRETYKGLWDWGKMVTWHGDVTAALVEDINENNIKHFIETTRPVGWFFVDAGGKKTPEKRHPRGPRGEEQEEEKVELTKMHERVKKIAEELAQKNNRRIQMGVVDHKPNYRMSGPLGLSGKYLPGFTIEAPFYKSVKVGSKGDGIKAHYPLIEPEREPLVNENDDTSDISDISDSSSNEEEGSAEKTGEQKDKDKDKGSDNKTKNATKADK
ncbi:MAG: hypothetical protein EZS28_049299, partial [Streblomastix strix]